MQHTVAVFFESACGDMMPQRICFRSSNAVCAPVCQFRILPAECQVAWLATTILVCAVSRAMGSEADSLVRNELPGFSSVPIHAINRLPRFSTSSSKRSARNMVAHRLVPLFFLAKRKADFLKRKTPPVRPSASRAIQRPTPIRAIKKSGIDSLRMWGSGRAGNLTNLSAAAGGSCSSTATSSPPMMVQMQCKDCWVDERGESVLLGLS